MKYLINGRTVSSWEFENSISINAERVARIELNEMLDKVYFDMCIENCTIYASEIFETCRPKEYKSMLRDRALHIDTEAYASARRGNEVNLNGNIYKVSLCDES